MTNEKALSALKFDLCSQLKSGLEQNNMNFHSFDIARSTAANLCNHGDGQIKSLLSMVDDMGKSIQVVDKIEEGYHLAVVKDE